MNDREHRTQDLLIVLTCTALVVAAALLSGCSGQSGSDRSCVVQGAPTQLTDRIALAQCGDGSICIGACGGQQDSGNTTDSNNPDNSDNSVDNSDNSKTTNNPPAG